VSRKILIIIMGEPVAQGRPRMSTFNGHARAYDPAKSRNWKQIASMIAGKKMENKSLMEGELSLSIRAYRSIPKSFSKKKTAAAIAGKIRPTTKPDLDNIVKSATDACNGILFHDDSQIVAFHEPFGKWFSDKPRVEIEVKEISNGR